MKELDEAYAALQQSVQDAMRRRNYPDDFNHKIRENQSRRKLMGPDGWLGGYRVRGGSPGGQ